MKTYDTLTEAINDLRMRGYTEDFNVVLHRADDLQAHPENFTVEEIHRFEGMTNPDDSSVLYAIASDGGVRGTLVDAYGAYTESLTPDMILKLRIKLKQEA